MEELFVKIDVNTKDILSGDAIDLMTEKGKHIGYMIVEMYMHEYYGVIIFAASSTAYHVRCNLRNGLPQNMLLHLRGALVKTILTPIQNKDLIDVIFGWMYEVPK